MPALGVATSSLAISEGGPESPRALDLMEASLKNMGGPSATGSSCSHWESLGLPWREWLLPHPPGTILRLLKTGVHTGGAEEEGPGKDGNSATQRAHAIR